jgi:type VI secretion system protein ImpM
MTEQKIDRTANRVRVGYFGKVPTQGDFVTRGLPRAVETALDGWLRAAVQESQHSLGSAWLDAFLVAPVWRMALGPGVAGPDPVAGVMIPSVDRVGRYFPLVVAAAMPGFRPELVNLAASTEFYDALESLALSTLSPDFALAPFEAAMEALGASTGEPAAAEDDTGRGQSLWWNGAYSPAALATDGLPPPGRFAAVFLEARSPVTSAAEVNLAPAFDLRSSDVIPHEQRPTERGHILLQADCASAMQRGARSPALTDIAVITPDHQALSLISGIGQHPGLASAMQSVAATLAGINNPYSMNDLLAEAKGKLGTANALLRARGLPTGEVFAASAVTLLIQAQRYAVLWAGKARAYLLRDNDFTPLTRDHVETRLPNLLTRALGATTNLSLDTAIGQVRPYDRFLLCSPGVFQALSEAEIAEILARGTTAQEVVTRMTQEALIAGATLDVAAVAVLMSPSA